MQRRLPRQAHPYPSTSPNRIVAALSVSVIIPTATPAASPVADKYLSWGVAVGVPVSWEESTALCGLSLQYRRQGRWDFSSAPMLPLVMITTLRCGMLQGCKTPAPSSMAQAMYLRLYAVTIPYQMSTAAVGVSIAAIMASQAWTTLILSLVPLVSVPAGLPSWTASM